jgi:hypothetical protein
VSGLLPALAVACVIAGCAAGRMEVVAPAGAPASVTSGATRVYFARSPQPGVTDEAFLFDGHDYIGSLSPGQHIAYDAKPGAHAFSVVTRDREFDNSRFAPNSLKQHVTERAGAGFLEAELASGASLYIAVQRRKGFLRTPFELMRDEDVAGRASVERTEQVRVTEEGREWMASRRDRFDRIRREAEPRLPESE